MDKKKRFSFRFYFYFWNLALHGKYISVRNNKNFFRISRTSLGVNTVSNSGAEDFRYRTWLYKRCITVAIPNTNVILVCCSHDQVFAVRILASHSAWRRQGWDIDIIVRRTEGDNGRESFLTGGNVLSVDWQEPWIWQNYILDIVHAATGCCAVKVVCQATVVGVFGTAGIENVQVGARESLWNCGGYAVDCNLIAIVEFSAVGRIGVNSETGASKTRGCWWTILWKNRRALRITAINIGYTKRRRSTAK